MCVKDSTINLYVSLLSQFRVGVLVGMTIEGRETYCVDIGSNVKSNCGTRVRCTLTLHTLLGRSTWKQSAFNKYSVWRVYSTPFARSIMDNKVFSDASLIAGNKNGHGYLTVAPIKKSIVNQVVLSLHISYLWKPLATLQKISYNNTIISKTNSFHFLECVYWFRYLPWELFSQRQTFANNVRQIIRDGMQTIICVHN